jgi:hypothetical protein
VVSADDEQAAAATTSTPKVSRTARDRRAVRMGSSFIGTASL